MNNFKLYPVMAAIMVLGSCQNSNKSGIDASAANTTPIEEEAPAQEEEMAAVQTATDIASFGLKGPVKEVRTVTYEATEGADEQLTKLEKASYGCDTICFNDRGMVTRDPFNGIYVYDDSGRFISGVTEKSEMKRDDKGRIVYYSQRNDDEDDGMFENDFSYDEQGRLFTVERKFWECTSTETYHYDSDDSIFPIKLLIERSDQGIHVTSENNYRYTEFDDLGNWIERELRYIGSETEEGVEEDNTTTWKGQVIERREIVYY